MNAHDNPTDEQISASKSQQKRQAQALFQLGRRLVQLNDEQLQRVPLSSQLRAAVSECRQIRAHIAHKRQLQYVAKLLRQIDTGPISAALEQQQQAQVHGNDQLHRLEAWRAQLLADGKPAIDALLARNPQADRQQLRALVRKAIQQAERQAAPIASRQLFQLLKLLDQQSDLGFPTDPDDQRSAK